MLSSWNEEACVIDTKIKKDKVVNNNFNRVFSHLALKGQKGLICWIYNFPFIGKVSEIGLHIVWYVHRKGGGEIDVLYHP